MSDERDDVDYDDYEAVAGFTRARLTDEELFFRLEAIMERVRWANYLSDPANWDQDLK